MVANVSSRDEKRNTQMKYGVSLVSVIKFIRVLVLSFGLILSCNYCLGSEEAKLVPPSSADLQIELEKVWTVDRVHSCMASNPPVPIGYQLPVIRDMKLGRLHIDAQPNSRIQWQVERNQSADPTCMITSTVGTNTWIIAYGPLSAVRQGRTVSDAKAGSSELLEITDALELAWSPQRISQAIQKMTPLATEEPKQVVSGEVLQGLLHPGREEGLDVIQWQVYTSPEGTRRYKITAFRGASRWLVASGDYLELRRQNATKESK